MIRLLLTCTTALILAAPLAAGAATTRTTHPRTVHHAAVHHTATRHAPMRATRVRDGGSAAVDQLNEQSLNNARGTPAPAATPAK